MDMQSQVMQNQLMIQRLSRIYQIILLNSVIKIFKVRNKLSINQAINQDKLLQNILEFSFLPMFIKQIKLSNKLALF